MYINKSYTYSNLKLRNYGTLNIYLSYKCTSDSQCLTNKCIDGVCIFNEEDPTEFCTSIYINLFIRFSYMYCGKMIGDICKKDKECGSKIVYYKKRFVETHQMDLQIVIFLKVL